MCIHAQVTLKTSANIHSIGYQVLLTPGTDSDSSARVTCRYRIKNGSWRDGFPPTRLMYDSMNEFRGSVFQASAATPYEIEITYTDSFPVVKKTVLSDTITTLREPVIQPGSNLKYVSPAGSGTAYTAVSPGNIKTLLASGLSCGTTVMVKGGMYDIGEMNLNLTTDCNEGSPIIIMAVPGETPVFYGADTTTYVWTRYTADTSIFTATIKPSLEYNALCMMDSVRLYPYGLLVPSSLNPAYPALSNLGYNLSGVYRKANQVYIKTPDHKNPNNARILFSKYFWCLAVNGNNKNNYLYIKGITFSCYSKGKCDKDIFSNPVTCYPSFTLQLKNAHHVIIDSCRFEYSNFPVTFDGVCNYNLVQNNTCIDQTGTWSHGAFKQTRDQNYLEPGSYGRYLENVGIYFTPGAGATIRNNMVRNNTIKGIVAGIGLSFDASDKVTEYDIYGNHVSYCYDGIDATFNCINTRIWGNEVDHCPVANSLILPSYGPTYVFRNVFHHISERVNQNDIFFMDCNNTASEKIWGTGLKVNTGNMNPTPGSIFYFHNTLHSIDTLGFNMYLWTATWKSLMSRNNIFYGEGLSNFFFDDVKNDSAFAFDSRQDDYYNARSGTIGIIQPVNGQPVCSTYSSPNALGVALANSTQSKRVVISGMSKNPGFINVLSDSFHLLKTSALIDQGMRIPGFNDDYEGAGPDIGAYETSAGSGMASTSRAGNDWMVFPNPASGKLRVTRTTPFNEATVVFYALDGREIQRLTISSTHAEITIQGIPAGMYFLVIEGEESTQSIKCIIQ